MLTRTVTICNKLGIHARPAALLTKTASLFECSCTITKGDKTIDAKSILSVMTIAAKCGDEITIVTDGINEAAALDSLVALIQSRFGEDE
ncbi:MAG: HPr family phosphocarrier protein [Duodenibacillus sp.]|jgi:phosphocarrier protein|nr:HPr family phosphocarrier protein [Duodenibacillus sp.]